MSGEGPSSDNEDDIDPLFTNPFKVLKDSKLVKIAKSKQLLAAPDEILVVNLMAKDNDFSGEDLLYILLACDCRFGEMNIFHRYEAENASGEIQFSIVNMVEPGIFDLQDINNFSTRGVSFFIRLSGPKDPIFAFDCMIETAQCLARNLNGVLNDEQHSTITEQTLEYSRERIRKYQKDHYSRV